MRYLILILCLIASAANSQGLIRGIVVDSATFAALPYVNVQIKSTMRGTTTDSKGNFSINATELDTLIFTLVGYRKLVYPLIGYEPSMIRLTEQPTLLAPITIHDSRISANPYEGMFDEQNAKLKKRIPFYYHKTRKDKIKAANWREEASRVQTYVDVVISDPQTKEQLVKKYSLSDKQYYDLLAQFNQKHYTVMYYLTRAELLSLLNRFFEANAPVK
jgi:hypothetical protein